MIASTALMAPDHLRRTAGEINDRAFAFDAYPHANRNFLVADAVVVKRVFRFVIPVGNRSDRATHQPR